MTTKIHTTKHENYKHVNQLKEMKLKPGLAAFHAI